MKVAFEHLAVEANIVTLEDDLRTGLELLTWVHQGFPVFRTPWSHVPNSQLANQQALDGAAARHAVSEQASYEETIESFRRRATTTV